MTEETIRINKFISTYGKFSRREVDDLILQGRITVNRITVSEPGFKVNTETDKVAVDGEIVKTGKNRIYIMLNKPAKVITSVKDEKRRLTVIDLINTKEKIFPVGRLDYETMGLLLLTNDGDFANKLMHPKYKIKKSYYVELSRPIEEKHRLAIEGGIIIDRVKTKPCGIKLPYQKDTSKAIITIGEGKNRQVRNMFEKFGYFVRKLVRIEYGSLGLSDLGEGQWRKLTLSEVKELTDLTEIEVKKTTKPAQFKSKDSTDKKQSKDKDVTDKKRYVDRALMKQKQKLKKNISKYSK